MNETIKGELKYGVEFPAGSEQYHYDFEMRLGTVEDHIDVYERPDILGGGVSNMRVNTALLALCLVSLGTVPTESITPELLGSAVSDDFDLLQAAQDALKKKRLRPKPESGSAKSDSQPPSSDSTESGKNDSAA